MARVACSVEFDPVSTQLLDLERLGRILRSFASDIMPKNISILASQKKQTEMRSFFTEEDGAGVGVHGLGQVRSGLHVETYRQAQGLKGMR